MPVLTSRRVRAAWLGAPVSNEVPEAVGRRWTVMLLASRVVALVMALGLLALGDFTDEDVVLASLGAGYATVSTAVLLGGRGLARRPLAWAADSAAALTLVAASGDWRSPFYLLWLTTLALPGVRVGLRMAAGLSAAAVGAFLVVAFFGGPEPRTLGATSSETLAIHLALPVLLILSLAYAADVLRRLERAQARSEELVLVAERQRIAWELHDSAKQRVHVAHLLITALRDRLAGPERELGAQAIAELESATAEMDTTLAGLRSPLAGRLLHDALGSRAEELTTGGGPAVVVEGEAGLLPEPLATNAYRIGVEAITNAVRHAGASRVRAVVTDAPERLRLEVVDDGRGLPGGTDCAGTGLLAMRSRATTLGGTLEVGPGPGGRGTRIHLEIPRPKGAPA